MNSLAAMLLALGIDAALGWPARIYARIGHPVTWIGTVIAWCDRKLNRETMPGIARRGAGVVTLVLVVGLVAGLTFLMTRLLPSGAAGLVLTGILAWPLLAARSLNDHVAAVAKPLATGDLAHARSEVAKIVGRDPNQLDEAGIARAAIESLAENASDGVIAPLFWGLLLGLPGIAAYKAVNTLDSMIGHRNPRHEAFGWASARFDDLVNLAPARLCGALIAFVSPRPRTALATMWREAPRHRSPNAGWPEAAMAAALGVRLSGPRLYAGRVAPEPWINAEARDPTPADITTALRLYRRMLVLAAALIAITLVMGIRHG